MNDYYDRPWAYREKLGTPQWFRRRQQILMRDKYTCRKCDWPHAPAGWRLAADPEHPFHDPSGLEIHHLYYKRTLQPWEYSDLALITLCDQCHQAEEKERTIFNRVGEKRTADEEFFEYILDELCSIGAFCRLEIVKGQNR